MVSSPPETRRLSLAPLARLMAVCRQCQAPVGWVRLLNGTPHPVESEEPMWFHIFPNRVQAGAGKRVVLITEAGEVVHGYVAPAGKGSVVKGWESHGTYCPAASRKGVAR